MGEPRYIKARLKFILAVDGKGAVGKIKAITGRLAGFWSIVAVDDEKSGQTDRPFFYRKIL
jgi:hypothetical protein